MQVCGSDRGLACWQRKLVDNLWNDLSGGDIRAPPTGMQAMFVPIAESGSLDVLIVVCIILNTAILGIQVRY